MAVIIEKFKSDRKWRFLWLQYINGVNLKHHCQRCLLGKTSKKIQNDTVSAENIVLDELDSRYYYLCGVAPSMALEDNFHLAFEECEGKTIEYSFNGISVVIRNAKRVEFSADDINWDVEHSDEELYNRCRNWQFAHKVSNGGENTKFKLSFDNEYILQKNTENNLDLFDLEFVASEFQYKKLRFDTLAFDGNSNSFVIIEYKNKYDANVLNQVKGYYDLLLENKQVYIDRLNEESEIKLKEDDLDKTRAMIIGPKFSDEQIGEADLPFEIWKVSLYDNLNVVYKQLKTNETKVLKVTEDDLKITDDDLLKDKSDELKDLYFEITNRVLKDFSNVTKKNLVGAFTFRLGNSKDYKYLISKLIFKNDYFLVYLYSKQAIIDEKLEDISDNDNIEAKASYRFKLESFEDINYFMEMFKKVFGEKIHE